MSACIMEYECDTLSVYEPVHSDDSVDAENNPGDEPWEMDYSDEEEESDSVECGKAEPCPFNTMYPPDWRWPAAPLLPIKNVESFVAAARERGVEMDDVCDFVDLDESNRFGSLNYITIANKRVLRDFLLIRLQDGSLWAQAIPGLDDLYEPFHPELDFAGRRCVLLFPKMCNSKKHNVRNGSVENFVPLSATYERGGLVAVEREY